MSNPTGQPDKTSEVVLSKSTGLSVGLVVSVIGGVIYLSTFLARLDATLFALDRRIMSLEEQVTVGLSSHWRDSDMAGWAATLQELNPSMKVPSIPSKTR